MLRILVALSMPLLACGGVLAAESAALYSAQTIVTGTVEPERTRGFRAGLVDVFIKLTGDARLADNETLRPMLDDPHHFVEHYEYEDRMKGIPVHDEQGTRERPHFLRMRFKRPETDNALARLGLSKWPSPRPLLAVWLGVRTAVGDYVLTKSGANGYGQRAVIVETSARRGIPVLLPEVDNAVSAVVFDDIAANDTEKLKRTSKRAEAWLSGVLSITERGYWDITWRFEWRNRSRVWTLRDVSFDTALKHGLQTAALVLSGNMPN